jgi:hypothetical protein
MDPVMTALDYLNPFFQIANYTDGEQERKLIDASLDTSQRILNRINERCVCDGISLLLFDLTSYSIRDQEGRETLRVISQNLWIGQGCASFPPLFGHELKITQSSGPHGADAVHGCPKASEGGRRHEGEERPQTARLPLQRYPGGDGRAREVTLPHGRLDLTSMDLH